MISSVPPAVRPPAAPTEIPLDERERRLRELAKAPDVRVAHRAVGLCASCDHRFDCAFPPVPGGVWHCEEFA
jgi:hypothetical protein